MGFDQSTRNRLARFVSDTRRILTDEFTRQCQQDYGIDPRSGAIAELGNLAHLNDTQRSTARILRETIEHYIATSPAGGTQAAVERLVREQAFTVLNRLAALRMAEARGIIIESVSKGYQSKGFQLYSRLAGSSLGETGSAYACYLFSTFDDLALDLAVLFDRFSPQGRLFPNEAALSNVLAQLNSTDLDLLWVEDETIGWLYQYFNSQEERKKMREESAAPRNSRELAVRNQFFTPRYVVEFLTDNTLGRIWYEMKEGQTCLKERCRYLVRRPTEIFLKPSEIAPEQPKQENLSQEDLLKQPVHIPHRPVKDPRTILMLDPACGSMHFGLYAFDLFEVIYDEAWALEEKLGADALSRPPGMKSLHDTYVGKDSFLKDVPRLIIEHNLHGIDIDPRCAQIAGLSLWLRAQKAWQRLGLKPAERPAIKRSNIVCAEPMPGERELLHEFVEREFPAAERAVCLRLLEAIFDKMQLAGEAGSLLKIEEEIRSAIEDARDAWQKLATKPPELFTTTELNQLSTAPELTGLEQAVSSLTTDPRHLTTDFWERIEERIYAALRDYAEQAETGGSFQRRLFAEDAARGFAFIDVCRKRYDVVLMNPPFGETTAGTKDLLKDFYTPAKTDLAMAFVSMGLARLVASGLQGAITTRAFVGNEKLKKWRDEALLGKKGEVVVFVDLGIGVLDALVEACIYIVRTAGAESANPSGIFVSELNSRMKADDLLKDISASPPVVVVRPLKVFRDLPDEVMCFWLPQTIIGFLLNAAKLSSTQVDVIQGMQTGDDFRFYRLRWEVPATSVGRTVRWVPVCKGGEYSPFFDDIHLMADWEGEAAKIKAYIVQQYPYLNGDWGWVIKNSNTYFRPGLTYPERTASDFGPRVMPQGAVFTAVGIAIQSDNRESLLGYLAGSYTRLFKLLVDAFVGSGDNSVSGSAAKHIRSGLLNALPHPLPQPSNAVLEQTLSAIRNRLLWQSQEETCAYFTKQEWIASRKSIVVSLGEAVGRQLADAIQIIEANRHTEVEQARHVGLELDLLEQALVEYGPHPSSYSPKDIDDALAFEMATSSEESLIARCVELHGARRQVTKKSFIADRRLELCAHTLGNSPRKIAECSGFIRGLVSQKTNESGAALAQFLLGVAIGRWDIRYATGEQAAPELPDPFAPLPVCPPGQLQNAQGLPARPEDVPAAYPVRIPWDGILVDDPNHPLDLERRVREVIEIIWSGQEGGPTAEAIEHEACEILGVKSLRDYFRKPAGFFADHLKRYSKSRRQAPIYWPLGTASGSYTLWIYYHRLTDQTLFTAINDFIEPKLIQASADASRLRVKANRSTADETSLEELIDLEMELKEFRDELLRIAAFWKPNLNDGVLITASPLWKLFKLKPWQKKLKETWDELEAGEYDWAHLALTIAPARVRLKCKTDKSIAIAHGLENLYEEPVGAVAKKKQRKAKTTEPMLGDEID